MIADYNNPDKYTKFKISDVSKPANDRVCWCNYYWVVTPDDCILLYRECSWQCNPHKGIVEKIIETAYPDCRLEYFDVLYLQRNWD